MCSALSNTPIHDDICYGNFTIYGWVSQCNTIWKEDLVSVQVCTCTCTLYSFLSANLLPKLYYVYECSSTGGCYQWCSGTSVLFWSTSCCANCVLYRCIQMTLDKQWPLCKGHLAPLSGLPPFISAAVKFFHLMKGIEERSEELLFSLERHTCSSNDLYQTRCTCSISKPAHLSLQRKAVTRWRHPWSLEASRGAPPHWTDECSSHCFHTSVQQLYCYL